MRISDPDKIIPSYIHRRDEGELWSLNFEGRAFCCWKCGSGSHIGDKCRGKIRTFEEVFGGADSDTGEHFEKPTWASVVRSGREDNEAHLVRVKEVERQVREDNARKEQEERRLDALMEKEKADAELARKESERLKQVVLKEAADKARLAKEQEDIMYDKFGCSDVEYLQMINNQGGSSVHVVNSGEPLLRFNDSSLMTAIKHKSWLEARAACRFGGPGIKLMWDPRLAIEYIEPPEGEGGEGEVVDEIVGKAVSPGSCLRGKKRVNIDDESDEMRDIDIEHDDEIDLMALGSSFITDDSDISDTSELSCREVQVGHFRRFCWD